MRRKSERTKKPKASPEKADKSKKGRTSRRRKASSSSEDESGEDASPQVPEKAPEVEQVESKSVESHQSDEKVWQVKSDDSSSGTGEIKKLKICLSTRLPSTPEPEGTPRGRRKLNRTVSETPSERVEGGEEKRRSRHKSRRLTRESRDGVVPETPSENDDKSNTVSETKPEQSGVPDTPAESAEKNVPDTTESKEIPSVNHESGPEKSIDERGDADHQDKNNEKRYTSLLSTPISKRRRSRRLSGSSPERDSSPEQSEPVLLPQISEEPELKQPEEPTVEESNAPECNQSEKVEIKTPAESDNVEQNDKHDISEKNKNTDVEKIQQVEQENSTNNRRLSEKVEADVQSNHEELKKKEEQCSDDTTQRSPSDVQRKNTSEETINNQTSKPSEVQTPDSETDEVFISTKTHVMMESNKISDKKEKHNDKDMDSTTTQEDVDSTTSNKDEHVNTESTSEVRKSTDDPEETYNSAPIVVSRKRRWGARVSKTSQSKPVSISTDILKDIIPDVKPAELEEAIEEKHQRTERKASREIKTSTEPVENLKPERPFLPKIVIDNTENANSYRREKEKEHKEKTHDNHLSEHRKISIIKDDNFKARPPSPARNTTSPVLYITNLVRPFTLAQLKNLLQRTGKIIPEGFWIDRIKSKCFVTYENEEQAIETRHALHGVTWPVSNPKTLQVDFSSPEALEKMRSAEEQNNDKPSVVPGTVEDWLREQDAKRERGETDDSKPWERRNITREWDVGKNEKEREKLRRDERPQEKRRHRSAERSPEPARKFKKKEEEAPAKMLDDLFRKTKTVPCIYWLPLSDETIAVKEEQRRQHMAEHERRLQELERNRAHRRH